MNNIILPSIYYTGTTNENLGNEPGNVDIIVRDKRDDATKKANIQTFIDQNKKEVTDMLSKTSKLSPEPVSVHASINNMICKSPFTNKTYDEVLKNDDDIDLLINNSYCYSFFLKWITNIMKTEIMNKNHIICVGHSNKMKGLYKSLNKSLISSIQETIPIQSKDYTITFFRHAFSCNNAVTIPKSIRKGFIVPSKLMELTGNETVIRSAKKDYDPSLTIYGMISAIGKGKQLDNNYVRENIKICVSPLIRTWQTAILLFGQKNNNIELNVCPFLTEAYPKKMGKTVEVKRGNQPIAFKWQLHKMYFFLKLLAENKSDFDFDMKNGKTVTLRFIDKNGEPYEKKTIITIQNNTIVIAYGKTIIDNAIFEKMESSKNQTSVPENKNDEKDDDDDDDDDEEERVELVEQNAQKSIGELQQIVELVEQNAQKSIGELQQMEAAFKKIKKQNLWRLELLCNDKTIKTMQIYDGINKLSDASVISACEENCDFGKVHNVARDNNCKKRLSKKPIVSSEDINRISETDSDSAETASMTTHGSVERISSESTESLNRIEANDKQGALVPKKRGIMGLWGGKSRKQKRGSRKQKKTRATKKRRN